ncbi:MAG: RagB/SusD family nutrient uptake outer membrane protein [Rikenellaceae bacterium]
MKKILYLAILFGGLFTVSCSNDWLLEEGPSVTTVDDFFTSEAAAEQCINAVYTPISWEFNDTYYNEWFIGDVMSDDALKGGQTISDMADAYDLENWKTNTNNTLILDYFRAQYMGTSRANLAIEQISAMEVSDDVISQEMKDRLLGEAYFLRAMYYFRLVRAFGGVPLVDWVIYSDDEWQQPRATADEVYELILADLAIAESGLWLKSEYDSEDTGRATKGAAQAMLLKVNLYLGNYADAIAWGEKVIASQEYSLQPDYADLYFEAYENGVESVFEIQYMEDAYSDYGDGNGFTRGTFTTIMCRSRSTNLGGGWGFNMPTNNLYDSYDDGDPRRDWTIYTPAEADMTNETEETYLESTKYLNRKLMMLDKDDTIIALAHNSRSPLNRPLIRYADVLLMYAEALIENGQEGDALTYVNEVRQRAINTPCLDGSAATIELLSSVDRETLRAERRAELAMEGHRWFDLCRWGIAKETMDAYILTENESVQSNSSTFVEGQHELLPIPSAEIELNPLMEQNPGY